MIWNIVTEQHLTQNKKIIEQCVEKMLEIYKKYIDLSSNVFEGEKMINIVKKYADK